MKRKKGAYSEYAVKFANGEPLFLPPRKLSQKPKFENGVLVEVADDDKTMTAELRKMCDRLIEISDGSQDVTGESLTLLWSIAAALILAVYDASDDELADALTIRFGTSQHDRLADQWPSKIYRWVLGGDDVVEQLANG